MAPETVIKANAKRRISTPVYSGRAEVQGKMMAKFAKIANRAGGPLERPAHYCKLQE